MFKIGDRVICKDISDNAMTTPTGIENGKVYTVVRISKCGGCGRETLHLKEPEPLAKWCWDKPVGFDASYYSFRFEKVIPQWVDELLENIILQAESEMLVPVLK